MSRNGHGHNYFTLDWYLFSGPLIIVAARDAFDECNITRKYRRLLPGIAFTTPLDLPDADGVGVDVR